VFLFLSALLDRDEGDEGGNDEGIIVQRSAARSPVASVFGMAAACKPELDGTDGVAEIPGVRSSRYSATAEAWPHSPLGQPA